MTERSFVVIEGGEKTKVSLPLFHSLPEFLRFLLNHFKILDTSRVLERFNREHGCWQRVESITELERNDLLRLKQHEDELEENLFTLGLSPTVAKTIFLRRKEQKVKALLELIPFEPKKAKAELEKAAFPYSLSSLLGHLSLQEKWETPSGYTRLTSHPEETNERTKFFVSYSFGPLPEVLVTLKRRIAQYAREPGTVEKFVLGWTRGNVAEDALKAVTAHSVELSNYDEMVAVYTAWSEDNIGFLLVGLREHFLSAPASSKFVGILKPMSLEGDRFYLYLALKRKQILAQTGKEEEP